jgi:GNAT superfamily N-acetyltransferase
MISEINIRDDSLAEAIHALLQAAYALEAELIGCANFPPLHESMDDLKRSMDGFLVYLTGKIRGVLAFDHSSPGEVMITRMVVCPHHLRQGIGTALLSQLERVTPRGTRIFVRTAEANVPAIRHYEKNGYAKSDRSVSVEGIPLVRLVKLLA